MATLGENLCVAIRKLEALLKKTPASPERDRLERQYDRLWSANQKLIDANVQQATVEYNAAIKILADANVKIQEAIDSLASVVEVIDKVAEVISVIDDLLKKVGVV